MIEEEGRVIAVVGRYARIEAQRSRACGHCEVKGACGTSLLERFFGQRPVELLALNAIGAQVGDRVAVGISEQGLLRAAVAAYLVPILALIAGALIGETLGGPWAEAASLLGALLGLVLAFWWLGGYSVVSAPLPGRQPLVLRRLPSTSIAVPGPESRGEAGDSHS
ncbi:SoxR reducing system RseC family protein [Thiocystis violacea]|uniref:SoxR reducing system RseC family protein n=1 Tax=Thiocystis violacea TaxID=13725 RepID=UPI0019065481|nr:SoxR reducing system RseC family protein [Thiocystis violacea]MBK1717949.1 Fis family transcriptional regulator [Thiocystis violacea]